MWRESLLIWILLPFLTWRFVIRALLVLRETSHTGTARGTALTLDLQLLTLLTWLVALRRACAGIWRPAFRMGIAVSADGDGRLLIMHAGGREPRF